MRCANSVVMYLPRHGVIKLDVDVVLLLRLNGHEGARLDYVGIVHYLYISYLGQSRSMAVRRLLPPVPCTVNVGVAQAVRQPSQAAPGTPTRSPPTFFWVYAADFMPAHRRNTKKKVHVPASILSSAYSSAGAPYAQLRQHSSRLRDFARNLR